MTEYAKVTVMVEEPGGHTEVLTFNRAKSPDMKIIPKVTGHRVTEGSEAGLALELVTESMLFSCILEAYPDDNGQCVIMGSTTDHDTAHQTPDVANGPDVTTEVGTEKIPTLADWDKAIKALQQREYELSGGETTVCSFCLRVKRVDSFCTCLSSKIDLEGNVWND